MLIIDISLSFLFPSFDFVTIIESWVNIHIGGVVILIISIEAMDFTDAREAWRPKIF